MSGGVVTVDVAELIAIYRTAGALHDLVYSHPADVDPHAANMAARGLSLALQRRLRDLQTGPVVRPMRFGTDAHAAMSEQVI